MSKFAVGDRVTKSMGVRLNGTIVTGFFWRDSTDGTYKAPGRYDVAVEWDDGTKGYCNEIHLDYEYLEAP